MTIAQVMAELQNDRQNRVQSRFLCRAIMVKNIKQYCDLISALQNISNIRIVRSDELFSNTDTMPNYENLMEHKYHNEWLILTGVSEYLRLFSKKEASDKRFANLWSFQAPASSTGRIIIPLWGCEAQWFDKSLHLNDDIRQDEFYINCNSEDDTDPTMNMVVLSGAFEQYKNELSALDGYHIYGLKQWYEYWSCPDEECSKIVLVTNRYRSIISTSGNVSVHLVIDTWSFIRENMPGANSLNNNVLTEEMQSVLFPYAIKGMGLEKALLSVLNVSMFSGKDIMGKWKSMPVPQKQIVSLWLSLHPSDTYINHCFYVEKDLAKIPDTILHEIFKFRQTKEKWTQEFRDLTTIMGLQPDDEFFSELDKIPAYEERLDYLIGNSREERVYLLRMVGKWMRVDSAQASTSSKLEQVYPDLFAYLCSHITNLDSSIQSYLARYKSHKLENTLPDDDGLYWDGVNPDMFEYRYSLLSNNVDDDTAVLWIDALGIEWMSLLNWSLANNCEGNVRSIDIVQANLPTETEYNSIWKHMDVPYEKLDKLDKLAHKGVIDDPDYYVCIEDQFAFVTSIYKTVSKLLKKYHRVIITGDHGTSRLAARFFHTKDGLTPPKGATVHSHGRYCDLGDEVIASIPNMRICKMPDGKRCAVFSNYDHYKKSGFAAGVDDENAIYGEVHGGATPEEMLVPIFVIDARNTTPISAEWITSTQKIKMRKVKFTLRFNKVISTLSVKVGNIEGSVEYTGTANEWEITFDTLSKGNYEVQVYANQQIVAVPQITVLPALGGGDGDLP